MRYSREAGFGLLFVGLLCFLVGAPPWMFLLTGLAAVGFGILGIRQRQTDADPSDENAADDAAP
jgi:hypothetical protein